MAQASNVIQLPRPDFSFKPLNFRGADLSEKYKANEPYIKVLQLLLEMTPARMKKKVAGFGGILGGGQDITALIADFESVAKDCLALNEMFTAAAARMVAVHAKLV